VSLLRPRREERRARPRAPALAKIPPLRDAWEHVLQSQALFGVGLDVRGAPALLAELRTRLPAFLQPRGVPDRNRLSSVESFFRYTEEEGA